MLAAGQQVDVNLTAVGGRGLGMSIVVRRQSGDVYFVRITAASMGLVMNGAWNNAECAALALGLIERGGKTPEPLFDWLIERAPGFQKIWGLSAASFVEAIEHRKF